MKTASSQTAALLLAFFAASGTALAAHRPASTTAATPVDTTYTMNNGSQGVSGVEFGYQFLGIAPGGLVGASGIANGQLHVNLNMQKGLRVGVGFGADSGFDKISLIFNGDYTFANINPVSAYLSLMTGFLKVPNGTDSKMGVPIALLLGFSANLSNAARLSFGYGLQFGLGSIYEGNRFGITNQPWGTVGFHYILGSNN